MFVISFTSFSHAFPFAPSLSPRPRGRGNGTRSWRHGFADQETFTNSTGSLLTQGTNDSETGKYFPLTLREAATMVWPQLLLMPRRIWRPNPIEVAAQNAGTMPWCATSTNIALGSHDLAGRAEQYCDTRADCTFRSAQGHECPRHAGVNLGDHHANASDGNGTGRPVSYL